MAKGKKAKKRNAVEGEWKHGRKSAKASKKLKKKNSFEESEKPESGSELVVLEREGVLDSTLISERAYYLAKRRHKMGWPGDETSDWLQAESQIRQEVLDKLKIRNL